MKLWLPNALFVFLAGCSAMLNSKREELKVPERQPAWVNEGAVDQLETSKSAVKVQDKGSVRYLDLATGAPLDAAKVEWPPDVQFWQPKKSALPFDEPSIERLGLYGSRVLAMGSKKPEGGQTSYGLVASDSQSAAIVWKHFAAAPLCKLSFPVVADDRVFFVEEAEYKSGSEVHTVTALDMISGKKIWSQSLKGQAQFFGEIVSVSDGKVWVRNYGKQGKGAHYRIYDAATGAEAGEMSTATEYKSLVIRGGVLYGVDRWGHALLNEAGATSPDSYLVALDAMTGAPLWKSPKQELCELRKIRVMADGTVLVVRYPAEGAKLKEAVMAFRGGR